MKKLRLNYSVCQYIPDAIRQEAINVGIAFHCPDEGNEYCKFINIKNKSRIKSFDDEYDPEYFNLMMENFKYHLDFDTIGTADLYGIDVNEFESIHSNTFLNEKLKYYVNEFRFLPVQKIESTRESFSEDIEDIIKTYLYYDRPKSERITRAKVKELLKKQIKSMNLASNFSNPKIKGFEDEEIFDLQYNDVLLKTLSFDYSNQKTMLTEYKIFMFDIQENFDLIKKKKIVVVVNNNFEESNFYTQELYDKLKNAQDLDIEIVTLSDYATNLMSKGI